MSSLLWGCMLLRTRWSYKQWAVNDTHHCWSFTRLQIVRRKVFVNNKIFLHDLLRDRVKMMEITCKRSPGSILYLWEWTRITNIYCSVHYWWWTHVLDRSSLLYELNRTAFQKCWSQQVFIDTNIASMAHKQQTRLSFLYTTDIEGMSRSVCIIFIMKTTKF